MSEIEEDGRPEVGSLVPVWAYQCFAYAREVHQVPQLYLEESLGRASGQSRLWVWRRTGFGSVGHSFGFRATDNVGRYTENRQWNFGQVRSQP